MSKRKAGLGDHLLNLVAAWRFARRSGRTLAVDWRRSLYLQDRQQSLFAATFEPVAELAGVPFLDLVSTRTEPCPEPFHPVWWTNERLAAPYRRADPDVLRERDAAAALIRSGVDVRAATVVFDGCLDDALPDRADCRAVLQGLTPVPEIGDRVAAFASEHLDDRPVVAVHIRHGNQPVAPGDHARHWTDATAVLERCATAAQLAAEHLGDEAVVFLATDSPEVEEAFTARVPQAVTYPKFHRPAGTGELHKWPLAFVTRIEATTEMWLLAKATALVRFPPGSYFSFYASVMKQRGDDREPVAGEQIGHPRVEW